MVEISLPIKTKGLELSEGAHRSLELEDSAGKLLAAAPAPRMWDSSKDPRSGESAHQAEVATEIKQQALNQRVLEKVRVPAWAELRADGEYGGVVFDGQARDDIGGKAMEVMFKFRNGRFLRIPLALLLWLITVGLPMYADLKIGHGANSSDFGGIGFYARDMIGILPVIPLAVMAHLVSYRAWYAVLFFVPIVGICFSVLVCLKMAKLICAHEAKVGDTRN